MPRVVSGKNDPGNPWLPSKCAGDLEHHRNGGELNSSELEVELEYNRWTGHVAKASFYKVVAVSGGIAECRQKCLAIERNKCKGIEYRGVPSVKR